MAIEGRITYAGSLTYPCPTGMLFLIAEDGTHHVMAKLAGGDFCQIAACEALTASATSFSEADLIADIATYLSVTEDTTPPAGGAGFIVCQDKIGCLGTSKVYGLAQNYSNAQLSYQILGIRYSITSEGSLAVDGYVRYLTGGAALMVGQYGGALGQAVIGGSVYYISAVGNGFDGYKAQLICLPVSTNEVVLTAESWADKRADLPGNMAGKDWWTTSSRDPKNCATVFEHQDGIGVLAYRTEFEDVLNSTLYMTVVSGTNPGTNTGQNDISSLFGIPFSDEGLNFAGDPSSFGDDWYTNPSINTLPDGRLEWWFTRGYSDQDGTIGYRRAITNPDLTGIEMFDLVQLDMTNEAGITLEAVHITREDSLVTFMIREDSALTFLQQLIPIADAETTDDECGAEDEADELATAITWPECVLTPSDILVEAVSPTVSPGRSFTCFEQIVKPDAGHWRIELQNIPIRTRSDVFQWREIESQLNGTVGAVLVPVYAAKLSATPIVATCSNIYPIGATHLQIEQTAGADIQEGMHFSIGEWLYIVMRADVESSRLDIAIWPPLRQSVTIGAALDFNSPVCRCRQEIESGMDANLELLRYSTPTVAFVEDV